MQAIFNKYCQGKNTWLTVADCNKMIIRDSKFDAMESSISYCFSMSKKTVMNELDEECRVKYERLTYFEFLEFLARLVTHQFEDSELHELPLEEKLEFIIEELFKIVGFRFKYPRLEIAEFSDSDDEY